MILITIETHGPFGISSQSYISDFIDWKQIIYIMKRDAYNTVEETKYFIRTLNV